MLIIAVGLLYSFIKSGLRESPQSPETAAQVAGLVEFEYVDSVEIWIHVTAMKLFCGDSVVSLLRELFQKGGYLEGYQEGFPAEHPLLPLRIEYFENVGPCYWRCLGFYKYNWPNEYIPIRFALRDSLHEKSIGWFYVNDGIITRFNNIPLRGVFPVSMNYFSGGGQVFVKRVKRPKGS